MCYAVHVDLLLQKGFFVTGTDTGVGKTAVCVALARVAAERGRPWQYFKPAESGQPSDSARVAAATGNHARVTVGCRFSAALAPQYAAEVAGRTIETSNLDGLFRSFHDAQPLIVEGAGGLLTPYAPGLSAADLAMRWHLPVLIVAANRLGCLNHTLLTIEAIQRRGLTTLGIVFNDLSENEAIARNPFDFTRLSDVPILAWTRPLGQTNPSAAWWYEAIERARRLSSNTSRTPRC